jgi:predicted dehydrogenase
LRPYNEAYLPFKWRGWWDFGTGALGDMGCHIIDLPYWALKLESPTRVQATVSSHHAETGPEKAVIEYEFPARGELPPVKLTWYDGGNKPSETLVEGTMLADNGAIVVGEKGTLYLAHGAEPMQLFPSTQFTDFKAPDPILPRSPGHYNEWINACRGGEPALSNFDYAAMLTETVLLGNIACRVDQPIEWDPVAMKFPNCPEIVRVKPYSIPRRSGARILRRL